MLYHTPTFPAWEKWEKRPPGGATDVDMGPGAPPDPGPPRTIGLSGPAYATFNMEAELGRAASAALRLSCPP